MKKHIKNLALLGILVTGFIIGANKLISGISSMNDNLPIGRGKFYNWKYGKVYYTKTGKGSPILLIHDLQVISSSYEWNKIIQKLSRNHTVYAVDLLGCGRSEKPNITYSNFLYVQFVNEFIRKVIGSKTAVIATGKSLSFTIMACQMEEANFDKIIGISPCDLYNIAKTPGKRKNLLKFLIELPVYGTLTYHLNTSKKRITNKMTDDYFYKSHLVSKNDINAYYKAAKLYDGQGKYLLASIKSNYTNINIIPAIQKINQSICLIGGKEHPYMSDMIEEYIEYNPAIEAAYISNTSYLPQLESPDRFVELINILLN